MVVVQVVVRNCAGDKSVTVKGLVSKFKNIFVEEVEGM